MNPECRAGKHRNCDGKAWRDDLGDIGTCLCLCHGIVERANWQRALAAKGQDDGLLVLDHDPATFLICECGKDHPHIHIREEVGQ